jgi:hypothetical protein
MKYWEIIADNLSKAGWSLGCVSAIDSDGRTIWIVDAHRGDGEPNAMCRPKKPLRRGATSRDTIGVMTYPQMIHSSPAWVYKSKSNS